MLLYTALFIYGANSLSCSLNKFVHHSTFTNTHVLVGLIDSTCNLSVCNSRDASMYFCERIYQAMALHPMDDKSLVRCILTRAEVSRYSLIVIVASKMLIHV